jgi:hypothetical protein
VLGEYRDLIGSRKNGVLGMLVLPTAILAIGSGIFLFFLSIFELTRNALTAIEVHAGIPLSYVFTPKGTFDWFYVPVDFFLLLGITMLLTSLTFILIGKHISKTPGKIALGVLSYTFLYGFVAPLWLLRATADVSFGKNRGWRG